MADSKSIFSDEQIGEMRKIAGDVGRTIPPDAGGSPEDNTPKKHIEHCAHQMVRIAHLAVTTKEGMTILRACQFGLNLGRLQELLGSYGGADAWWRTFKIHFERGDWKGLKEESIKRLNELGIKMPTDDEINRI